MNSPLKCNHKRRIGEFSRFSVGNRKGFSKSSEIGEKLRKSEVLGALDTVGRSGVNILVNVPLKIGDQFLYLDVFGKVFPNFGEILTSNFVN